MQDQPKATGLYATSAWFEPFLLKHSTLYRKHATRDGRRESKASRRASVISAEDVDAATASNEHEDGARRTSGENCEAREGGENGHRQASATEQSEEAVGKTRSRSAKKGRVFFWN